MKFVPSVSGNECLFTSRNGGYSSLLSDCEWQQRDTRLQQQVFGNGNRHFKHLWLNILSSVKARKVGATLEISERKGRLQIVNGTTVLLQKSFLICARQIHTYFWTASVISTLALRRVSMCIEYIYSIWCWIAKETVILWQNLWFHRTVQWKYEAPACRCCTAGANDRYSTYPLRFNVPDAGTVATLQCRMHPLHLLL